jgi:hypothetical protein
VEVSENFMLRPHYVRGLAILFMLSFEADAFPLAE